MDMETDTPDMPRQERQSWLIKQNNNRLLEEFLWICFMLIYLKILKADIGSEVEMWGNNIPVDEVAKNSGTVGYELLCNVTASTRVPLEYEDG